MSRGGHENDDAMVLSHYLCVFIHLYREEGDRKEEGWLVIVIIVVIIRDGLGDTFKHQPMRVGIVDI